MTTINTNNIKSTENFSALVQQIQNHPNFRQPIGCGIFRAQFGQLNKERILTGTFPVVNWGNNPSSAAVFMLAAGMLENPLNDTTEMVVNLTPEIIQTMQQCFTPYWHEAKGKSHKNVQVVKHLATFIQKNTHKTGTDINTKIVQRNRLQAAINPFKIVFIFKDAAVESLPTAYLKLETLSQNLARTLVTDGISDVLMDSKWCGNNAYEPIYLEENEITLKMKGTYPHIDYIGKLPPTLRSLL